MKTVMTVWWWSDWGRWRPVLVMTTTILIVVQSKQCVSERGGWSSVWIDDKSAESDSNLWDGHLLPLWLLMRDEDRIRMPLTSELSGQKCGSALVYCDWASYWVWFYDGTRMCKHGAPLYSKCWFWYLRSWCSACVQGIGCLTCVEDIGCSTCVEGSDVQCTWKGFDVQHGWKDWTLVLRKQLLLCSGVSIKTAYNVFCWHRKKAAVALWSKD